MIRLILAALSLTATLAVADDPRSKIRGTMNAKGEYVPPTELRSEAVDGRLYMALRDVDDAAGKYAEQLHPQPPFPSDEAAQKAWQKGEEARLDKWQSTYAQELKRRLNQVASREKLPVEELEDIRMEGDAFAWFAEPKKRANLGKTPEQLKALLGQYRESKKLEREQEKAARTKTAKKKTSRKR